MARKKPKNKKGIFNKVADAGKKGGKWMGKNMPFTSASAAFNLLPGSQLIVLPIGLTADGLNALRRAGQSDRKKDERKKQPKTNKYMPKDNTWKK
jgi:hypothetical protein